MIDTMRLPSARWISTIEEASESRLNGLDEAASEKLLAALGALAIALVRRAPRFWHPQRQLASQLVELGAEDPDQLDLAVDRGFLIGDQALRFCSREEMVYFAARRILATEDAEGDLDRRLRGALFDTVALAVAQIPDPVESAQMLRDLVESEGPYEDLLELASMQACLALAFGAAADDELRDTLIDKALHWVVGPAQLPHAYYGAAALIAELRGGPLKDKVRSYLNGRVRPLRGADIDPEEAAAQRHWSFIAWVAGLESHADAAEIICSQLNPALWANAAEMIALNWRPNAARENTLREIAEASAPFEFPLAWVETLTPDEEQRLIKQLSFDPNDDDDAVTYAAITCDIAVKRPELSASFVTALSDTICQNDLPAVLRSPMAAALRDRPELLPEKKQEIVSKLERLLRHSDNPTDALALSTALLFLGEDDPDFLGMLVAAAAGGFPPSLLTDPLANPIRSSQKILAGLFDYLLDDNNDLALGALTLLQAFASERMAELQQGPFAKSPFPQKVCDAIAVACSAFVGSRQPKELEQLAAPVAAWFGRPSPELAKTLIDTIRASHNPEVFAPLYLALGATRRMHPRGHLTTRQRLGPAAAASAASTPPAASPSSPTKSPNSTPSTKKSPSSPSAARDNKGHAQALRELLISLAMLPAGIGE